MLSTLAASDASDVPDPSVARVRSHNTQLVGESYYSLSEPLHIHLLPLGL